MTDLTVNIRGLTVGTPQAAAALRALGSRWALVETNPGMARELAARGWRVVYRDYWPAAGDDNLHTKTTPAAWIDHMARLNLPADTILIAGNEPTRLYPELVGWTLEAMRLARARGWRLAVGSFATGNPGEFDWDDALLPLLEALQDGWHVLSLHEYITTSYKISVPWHVGRFKYALDACRVHGLKAPRIFITETGLDVTGSWQSLGLSAAAFAAEIGQAVREVWRPAGVEMAALFSLGAWSVEHDGHRWEFDVTPALGELAKIGQGEEPMDMTTREAGTVRPANGAVNIRASANGNIVGSLTAPVTARRTVETASKAGLVWRHYELDNAIMGGWMADSVIAWKPAEEPEPAPDPEPTPEPEPEPAPAASWLEFLRTMRELLHTQQQAIGVMLEYIEQELGEAA